MILILVASYHTRLIQTGTRRDALVKDSPAIYELMDSLIKRGKS